MELEVVMNVGSGRSQVRELVVFVHSPPLHLPAKTRKSLRFWKLREGNDVGDRRREGRI